MINSAVFCDESDGVINRLGNSDGQDVSLLLQKHSVGALAKNNGMTNSNRDCYKESCAINMQSGQFLRVANLDMGGKEVPGGKNTGVLGRHLFIPGALKLIKDQTAVERAYTANYSAEDLLANGQAARRDGVCKASHMMAVLLQCSAYVRVNPPKATREFYADKLAEWERSIADAASQEEDLQDDALGVLGWDATEPDEVAMPPAKRVKKVNGETIEIEPPLSRDDQLDLKQEQLVRMPLREPGPEGNAREVAVKACMAFKAAGDKARRRRPRPPALASAASLAPRLPPPSLPARRPPHPARSPPRSTRSRTRCSPAASARARRT